MSSPIYNPPVPYSGHIVGGFHPGRMVRIQGRATSSANSIVINLQTGPNASYDDIALHFNPRFNESCIVRNSRSGSGWGSEERQGPPLPIYRDQNFEILIMSEASMYKIAVNGQHFTEFTHRVPVEHVSFISVEGDLTISLIQFDGSGVTQSSAFQASAPPMGFGGAAVGGGLPYPTSGGGLPSTGFSIPPPMGGGAPYPGGGGGVPYPAGGSPYPAGGGGSHYPSSPQGGGYPPPNSAPVYGGYNPGGGPPPQQYPPPTSGPGYYPQQPGGYPGQQPQGYYPPPQGYDPHSGHSGSSGGGGGMLGGASKLLAGGLAGVGLAKVANKIPGLGGGGHGGHGGGHYGGGGYAPGGHHGGGGGGGLTGMVGKVLGPAAALGVGGMVANKATKGHKKNKMLKYGLPVGGALVGGYALKKGMKGFGHHGHGSSSSSSSSSEEE